MNDQQQDRKALLEELYDRSREMSTWTVLFHSAIADQVGLNITDHKCLDILSHSGSITAGQLAEITGLTTGAVTGVIDRLEKGGYVRRERDPEDRRKVIVQTVPQQAERDLKPLFDHFVSRYAPLLERYKDEELRLILGYIQWSNQVMQEEIDWLRKKPAEE